MKHAAKIDAEISQLLNAIDAWREADTDFALNGERDEAEKSATRRRRRSACLTA